MTVQNFRKRSNKQIQTKTGYRRTEGLTDKHEFIGTPLRESKKGPPASLLIIIAICSGNNPKSFDFKTHYLKTSRIFLTYYLFKIFDVLYNANSGALIQVNLSTYFQS